MGDRGGPTQTKTLAQPKICQNELKTGKNVKLWKNNKKSALV